MDILIRHTNGVNNANAIFTDHALEVDTLRIGSAADQELQLVGNPVSPQHGEITLAGKNLQIRCRRGASVSVNGQNGRKFTLSPDDIIELGDYVIQVENPPTGFDATLLVSRSSNKEAVNYEQFYKTDLSQTSLSPRLFGWVLSLAVLAIAAVIPLIYHYQNRSGEAANITDISWPITDTVWSSGPLHTVHASLEESCESCHVELFQRVSNESCLECHGDTQDHILAVAENEHLPIDINGRCASCHREHNEPVSSLIITSDKLCADCHAPHDLNTASTTLARVEEFSTDKHAPFQVSLFWPPEEGSFDPDDIWPIKRLPLADAQENSQLKFNHEIHYDSSKVTLNQGESLDCGHCHELSVDGEHFEDIAFEQNCANSGCHTLELDPRNRLPHGQPDIAVAAIEGFYLRKFGNPDANASDATIERRRRLDRTEDDNEKCTGSAYACARELAASKIEQQFTTTGCITCHSINDVGGEVLDRYQVAVVKLNENYFANARFDHEAHDVMVEPGSVETFTGDDSCVYCHAAPTSSSSTDLLIPAMDNCTTCHNGPERTSNVPLGCIDCHAYHPSE